MSEFLLSQLIAGGALTAALLTFQFKRNEYILVAFAVMSSLISLHFYVLGEYTASAIVALSVARFITSIFSKHYAFMYLFLALTILVGWLTYAEWYNLIAIAAGLLGVTATFQQEDRRLRTIMMTSNATMALHDAIVWTPVGIAVDLTVFFSGVIGYYRYYVQKTAPDNNASAGK